MEAFGLSSNQVAGWGRRRLQFTPSPERPPAVPQGAADLGVHLNPAAYLLAGDLEKVTSLSGPLLQGASLGSVTGPGYSSHSPLQLSNRSSSSSAGPAFQGSPAPAIPLLSAVTFQLSGHFPTLPEAPSSLSPHALQAQATLGVTLRSTQKAYSTGQRVGLRPPHLQTLHFFCLLSDTHTLGSLPAALSPPVFFLSVYRAGAFTPLPSQAYVPDHLNHSCQCPHSLMWTAGTQVYCPPPPNHSISPTSEHTFCGPDIMSQ